MAQEHLLYPYSVKIPHLNLLEGAGLVSGLPKYSGKQAKQRASSPKLQVLNTALMTATASHTFESARRDREYWGRLVESAVGAYLVNSVRGSKIEVFYLAGKKPRGGFRAPFREKCSGARSEERTDADSSSRDEFFCQSI